MRHRAPATQPIAASTVEHVEFQLLTGAINVVFHYLRDWLRYSARRPDLRRNVAQRADTVDHRGLTRHFLRWPRHGRRQNAAERYAPTITHAGALPARAQESF